MEHKGGQWQVPEEYIARTAVHAKGNFMKTFQVNLKACLS